MSNFRLILLSQYLSKKICKRIFKKEEETNLQAFVEFIIASLISLSILFLLFAIPILIGIMLPFLRDIIIPIVYKIA